MARYFKVIEIDSAALDSAIRKRIPSGRNVHEGRCVRFDELQQLRCFRELKDTKRLERSIGTLGGGNHFIEIDTDSEGTKYLIIHTGSRNLGKQVAEYYQHLAIEIMQGKDELYAMQEKLIADYKAQGRKAAHIADGTLADWCELWRQQATVAAENLRLSEKD